MWRVNSFSSLLLGLIVCFITSSNSLMAAKGKCEIRMALSLAESEWSVFKKTIFPAFEKQTKCRVRAEQVDADGVIKLLKVAKGAKKAPPFDLVAQDNMKLAPLVKAGLVSDLTSRFKSDSKDRGFIKTLMEGGEFSGKDYFVAFRPNVMIMYYNAEKFKQFKLKPPKTWKDLMQVAKTFKAKEKTGKILFKAYGGAPTATQLYEWIVVGGGDPFDFRNKKTQAAFLFLRDLWPYMAKDSLKAKWDTSNDYIANETVYLMQNWPFGLKIIREQYKKSAIKVYGGIKGERRAHVIGGDMLAVPAGLKADRQQMAVKLMRFLRGKEIQTLLVKELGWPSIRSDAYAAVTDPLLKEQFVAVNDALKYGIFRKNVTYWHDFQKLINELFDRVVVRQESKPEKLFKQYAKDLDKVRR